MRADPPSITALFSVELPIVQAPMAGASGPELAVAVSEAGGLGSLPCAMLSPEQIVEAVGRIRERTTKPFSLNFFCHDAPSLDPAALTRWQQRLTPYYQEHGIEPEPLSALSLMPFDDARCRVVETLAPAVVSFHFGVPAEPLMARVKATGAKVIASATTPDEAALLEAAGCDAIIAQGVEAGGHRGMFATRDVATQIGTIALVPLVVDRVGVPVVAAGGIADARGVAAAFALGAAGVQIGTAYLRCPEVSLNPLYRAALDAAASHETALTNVFTGRPARSIVNRAVRELGPIAADAPAFPSAAAPLGPVRNAAEARGSRDFTPLWAGQAASFATSEPAGELTRRLAVEARSLLGRLASA